MNTPVLDRPALPVAHARLPHCLPLDTRDVDAFRQTLRDYFLATYDRDESLYKTLACEAGWYERAIALRHPLIFYYGHTATFFVNKLILTRLIEERIDPHLESVFAVGVDEMSWDDLDDAHYDWPSIADVQAYRDKVRARVTDIIEHAPLTLPIGWDHPWWAIVMGIEHERIHLETSSVLIRQQRLDYVKPQPDWAPSRDAGEAPTNILVSVPAGSVALGRGKDEPRYGWDNEYGHHEADVPAFKASRLLVSNGEFLAFVEAGGYRQPGHWEEEGQRWLAFSKATHPTFWIADGPRWKLRLMTEEVPMPWNWPVEVNAHEARAFCQWKSAQSGQSVRLPSEDEWHRMLAVSGWRRGDDANLYLDHGASSCPVNRFAHGDFCDIVGNVWQWTETPTYPFDGFDVHPIYDDFTTPTFDGRHAIIKGGSWASTGNEAEPDARYAFRRHFFQHAGFRYVIADNQPVPPSQYETDKLLSEYAEFHYGAEYFGVPNFPRALADLVVRALGDGPRHRALDIGCASGRASFELARHFDDVTGIDFSARFIHQGATLARGEPLRYALVDEGELATPREVRLADLGLQEVADKVTFWQGDACNLKPQFTGYDVILAANLVDRLYDPAKFLATIHERLHVGGLLLIATPCTWLAEHTPREQWLGGFAKDGQPVRTIDGLRAALDRHFEAVGEPSEVPFVIRETRHKFQHTLSEASLWRRVR
ncbi:MAG TPA: 5-histidylcysteine sulfoxide synthase [Rhodanobacteraceae bacterium]|nr:5-histidylcysteine sulfoxide synthase [Rhodanobacteraceae bacterium]